jgi:hypothetical protein
MGTIITSQLHFLPGKTLVSVPLHVKNTWLRCFQGLSSLIRSCKKAVTTSGQVDLILISCLSCNGIPHNPHSSDPKQVNSFIAYMFIQEFAQLLIYWRIFIVIGKKTNVSLSHVSILRPRPVLPAKPRILT